MSGWNFDIDAAPKGYPEQSERVIKGKPVAVETYVHEKIIVAGNGGVVTVSKWLPDEERWEMFTKDVPPLAWQPWPKHPELAETEGGEG